LHRLGEEEEDDGDDDDDDDNSGSKCFKKNDQPNSCKSKTCVMKIFQERLAVTS